MAHIFSVIVDYVPSKTMKSASSNLILCTAKVAVDGCSGGKSTWLKSV